MKYRKLVAQEVVNGVKRILGLDEQHAVCETKQDCIELITSGTITVGDINSGYSVRRQRELRGSESAIDKFAKTFGFENADAMELELGTKDPLEIIKMARAARLTNDQRIEQIQGLSDVGEQWRNEQMRAAKLAQTVEV